MNLNRNRDSRAVLALAFAVSTSALGGVRCASAADPASTGLPAAVAIADVFPAEYFVTVPAGEFMMGTAQTDAVTPKPGRSPWTVEQPQHRVTLQSFEMGKYEITQRQWATIMGKNNAFFKGMEPGAEEHGTGMVYATAVASHFENALDQPVEQVSWKAAHAFIAKLNDLDPDHTYRLPTEAEWEYACRAGTTGDYAGDLDEMAWYYSREAAFKNPQPHPVGTKKPNAWGLYDMHGNVWEWCEDPWHFTYVGAHADGSVWDNARSIDGNYPQNKVLRGGSWLDRAPSCRSANRWYAISDFGINWVGFRVVRGPKEAME